MMNMQAITQNQSNETQRAFTISVEFIAYAAIICLSLLLRIAELDSIPLSEPEAQQALASWHVVAPNTPGPLVLPESPLLFTLNNLMFSIMGSSETSARLLTALAGVLLLLTPALFRDLLGRTRALTLVTILTCSPVALLAARFGSPVVWSMLFALVGLWGVWHYWKDQNAAYAVLAAGSAAALIFLTEPGGMLLLGILIVAGMLALWLTTLDAPNQSDMTGSELLTTVSGRFANWPLKNSLLTALLVVLVVSTGFMFYPAGISTIGELFNRTFTGFTTAEAGAPGAFPLMVALFYEPFLWIFAGISLWLLYRRGAFNFVERFFLAWVGIALIVAILYPGAGAAHALWLVIPLAGLVSYTATLLLIDDDTVGGWEINLRETAFAPWQTVPRWAKWLVAAAMLILLMILTMHFQVIGRSLITFPVGSNFNDLLNLMLEARYVTMLRSIIWLLLAIVFIVVGYLLTASLWGNFTAAQGIALGGLIFGLVTSLGSGWTAAVPNAANPIEPWHVQASDPDTFLLRQTLFDLAKRETGGAKQIPIIAVVEGEGVITVDGVVAWLLRDYVNTQFVPSIEGARTQEIVLLKAPLGDADKPELGGSYVGQSFVISRGWDSVSLQTVDLLAWWSQRQVRIQPQPVRRAVLWVRQDIFNGTDLTTNP